MLALTVVGSIIVFNIPQYFGNINPVGLDHALKLGLSVILLLVAISATRFVHKGIAIVILLLTALSALVAALAFLLQLLNDFQQLPSTLVQIDTNLFSITGLAAAAIISLLWLTRPFTITGCIILLVIFGVAAVCVFLQYSHLDTDLARHIYLIKSLILLILGVLIATQTERVRTRRGKIVP